MEANEDKPEGSGLKRRVWFVAWWVVAVFPIGLFAVMGWNRRWISDDGFINLRVVRNILAGHGPVFNLGERVEAFTSSLWVGLLTFVSAVGAPLEAGAVVGGIVCSVLGLVLAMLGSVVLYAESDETLFDAVSRRWLFPAGAITYTAVPVAWDYASSGLETGLALLWLGGAFLSVNAYQRDAHGGGLPDVRLRLAAGMIAGLGPLVRPELALFSIGWLGSILLADYRNGHLDWGGFGSLAASAGAIPVGYQIFRMGYYAALVPNTAFAKSAFGANWTQGLYFAENFFGMYLLAIPLVMLGLGWLEALVRSVEDSHGRRLLGLTVPIVCSALYIGYVIRIGGGFMHGRLLLPPFFGLCLPLMFLPVRWEAPHQTHSWTWRRCGAVAAVVLWAVVCAANFRVPEENQHGIGDERGWYSRQAGVSNPVQVEDYSDFHFHTSARRLLERVREHCPSLFSGGIPAEAGPSGEDCERFVVVEPHRNGELIPSRDEYPLAEHIANRGIVFSVLRVAMGIKGMVLGKRAHLVDKVGLADPVAARLELKNRGRPGHEKSLENAWYVARMAAKTNREDVRVTAAREAMRCGSLGTLLRSIGGPLSFGEFIKNIYRSVALHGLTIPANPLDAYHEFCGGKPPFQKVVGGTGGNLHRWRCPLGWAVSSIETTRSPQQDAIGSMRITCRPVNGDDIKWAAGDSLQGPLWGRRGAGKTDLRCEASNHFMIGLEGGADQLVRRVGGLCGESTLEGASQVVSTKASIGEGGSSVQVRCPAGQIMVGMKVRSGTMIDAMGIICQPFKELDTL